MIIWKMVCSYCCLLDRQRYKVQQHWHQLPWYQGRCKVFKGEHWYKTVCLFNCSHLFNIQGYARKSVYIFTVQTLEITMNIIKRTYLQQCYFELHKMEKNSFFAKYANLRQVSGHYAKSRLESCLSRFHMKKNVSGILETCFRSKITAQTLQQCLYH